jgi:hypothetical protein
MNPRQRIRQETQLYIYIYNLHGSPSYLCQCLCQCLVASFSRILNDFHVWLGVKYLAISVFWATRTHTHTSVHPYPFVPVQKTGRFSSPKFGSLSKLDSLSQGLGIYDFQVRELNICQGPIGGRI